MSKETVHIWPESQICIGCLFAKSALVHSDHPEALACTKGEIHPYNDLCFEDDPEW